MYLPRRVQRVKQKLIAAGRKRRDKISRHLISWISSKYNLLPYLVAIVSMLCKLKVWKSGCRFSHVYNHLVRIYNPVSMAAEPSEWNKAAFNGGGHHGEPTHRHRKKNTKKKQKTDMSQWNTAAFLNCILVFFSAFIQKFSHSGKMRHALFSSTAVLTEWCSKACSYFLLAWLRCEEQPQPARELYTSVLSPHSLHHRRHCNKP